MDLIVPIFIKMVIKMNPMHTRLINEIFANFAISLYRQSGMVIKRVAMKTITSLLAKIESWSKSDNRIITFVTVSPTTTLYDTIAERIISHSN